MSVIYTIFSPSDIILFIILLVVVILDYITGIASAYINGVLSSKIGFKGIIKKTMYFIIILVTGIISYIINIDILTTTTLWLIINDIISILENIQDLNVPLPEFLLKIITKLKETKEK